MQKSSTSAQVAEKTRSPKEFFNLSVKQNSNLKKVVNTGNKKNTVNVGFSNVLLTFYKPSRCKKFKSNTKQNFKFCMSFNAKS